MTFKPLVYVLHAECSCTNKYRFNMNAYVRVANLIKSNNVDIIKKVKIFSMDDLKLFIGSNELVTPYRLLRKVKNYIP